MATAVNTSTQSAFGFDPRTIPGCAVWLDAADINTFTPANPTAGTAISQWNDKSGNNRHATQSTLSNRPVYSSSDLSIDTTTNPRFFNMTSMPAAPYDIFVVARPTATTADWRTMFRTNTGDPGLNPVVLAAGSSNLGYYASNAFAQFGSYTWAPSTRNMLFARMNATRTMNASLNGDIALTTNTIAPGAASDVILYLGATVVSGLAFQGWGNINEVIFYTTPLSTVDRQEVEGYLAWKWGLRANLPLAHPFKTNPTTMRLFQPIDIDSCITWLDASEPSAFTFSSGSNISNWIDRSGFNNTATEMSTTRPTWSSALSAVVMTSSNVTLMRGSLGSSFSSNSTVFFVGSYISNATSIFGPRTILLGNSASPGTEPIFVGQVNLIAQTTPPFVGAYVNNGANPTGRGTNVQTAIDISYSTPFIYTNAVSNVLSGGTITFNIDSAVDGRTQSRTSNVISNTGNVVTYDKYSIGGYMNSTTDPGDSYNGNIHECIIYSSLLTVSQRQQIEGYLAWKWRIYPRLASTHPFKNFPSSTPLFVPNLLSNLQLWLDATDPSGNGVIPANGSTITTWVDKARIPNNMTATGTVTYQGSPPRLVMNSSFMSATFSYGANTLFIVYNQTGTSGPVFTTNNAEFTGLFPNESGSTFFARSDSAWASQASTLPRNTINMISVQYAGTPSASAMNLWLYGVLNLSSTTSGTITRDRLSLAVRSFNDPDQLMTGNYHEVILYNAVLTTNQRQRVEGYLAWKWGLQNSLPATHPYYKFRP